MRDSRSLSAFVSCATLLLFQLAPAERADAQTRLWKKFGTADRLEVGRRIDVVGDLDGDGVADLIVGIRLDGTFANRSGRVLLKSGADGTTIASLHGVAGEKVGTSVCRAGDVDGDSIPDYAFGTADPGATGAYAGAVSLYSGASNTLLWQVQGSAGDILGTDLADVGDLDGDGIDDLVAASFVGAYVRTLSGKDGSTLLTVTSPDLHPVSFGFGGAAGGDVDGDGFGDFMVADTGDQDPGVATGAAYVFSGVSGALLYRVYGVSDGARMGDGMAILGDLDQDGYAEFAAGAPGDQKISQNGGLALICSGKDGHVLFSYQPKNAADKSLGIGGAFSRIGDVNRDGFEDFLVDNTLHGETYDGGGAVFLYSGSDGGLLYHYFDNDFQPGNDFGAKLAPLGDVDGDGNADFLAGSPDDSSLSCFQCGSISAWATSRLFCDSLPRSVPGNTDVTVTVGQAIPSQLFAIFIVENSGVSIFKLLNAGTLDATGRTTVTGHWPGGGNGYLSLQAFTLDAQNHLLTSNVEKIWLGM